MVKLITDLTEDISAAVISYWTKDDMRNELKAVKKAIDDKERARKAALLTEVVDTTKALLAANPGLPFLVYRLNACAQNKALDGALKQVKALSPDTAAILFSEDEDAGKVLCMAQAPKDAIGKGLKANEWCAKVQSLLGGRGGGKPENAQATGANISGMCEAMKVATDYAKEKLGLSEAPVIKEPTAIKE